MTAALFSILLAHLEFENNNILGVAKQHSRSLTQQCPGTWWRKSVLNALVSGVKVRWRVNCSGKNLRRPWLLGTNKPECSVPGVPLWDGIPHQTLQWCLVWIWDGMWQKSNPRIPEWHPDVHPRVLEDVKWKGNTSQEKCLFKTHPENNHSDKTPKTGQSNWKQVFYPPCSSLVWVCEYQPSSSVFGDYFKRVQDCVL